MKARGKPCFLAVLVLLALLTGRPLAMWAQKTASATDEKAVKTAESEKLPPPAPAPGFFPLGMPASPVSNLDLGSLTTTSGPITGPLAPYGRAAASEAIWQDWRGHRLGALKAAPFLEYDALYRSNVFRSSTGKQADWVHAVNPGLRLVLPLGPHRLSLNYLGNYFLFSRFSHLSHDDHNFSATAVLDFPRGLTIRLGYAFRAASEEPSTEHARLRPYRRHTPYVQAVFHPTDKWQVKGFYQFDALEFDKGVDKSSTFREHAGGVMLHYRFWPKTGALIQYIITSRTYPGSPQDDSLVHTPLAGFTWNPTAKLSNTLKFGISLVNYRRKLPGRDNSPEHVILSLQTVYRYGRRTLLTLTVQRSKQDDVDFGNRPFWHTGIFLALKHEWHYFRLTTYATFSFINNSYLNRAWEAASGTFKRREDNIFYVGAGLSRPLNRWLRLRLDWRYLDDSSNFSGFSYTDHQVLAGLKTAI
ncbi:MAG: outer membrane beta-barrel protein [Deltaproteobacteria bacterium]|nr:outer membrane beta-barrel protein [Deltaproteobacteria bacterium]